jgi:predicted MFS family arabinose efflux permease
VSANIATAVMASGMFGMFFLLTLYLQQVLRYSPLETGLAYVPFGFGLVTGITISTKIIERVGARAVIATAYTIAGAGLLLLGGVTVNGSYVGDLLPTILMLSFGMGAAFPAIQIAALHQVSEENAGLGSGVQNTVLQVGGALGLAVLVTLAVRRTASSLAAGNTAAVAATDGYALAFRIAALALFAAALVGLALVPGRKREAATERVIEDGLVEPVPAEEVA